MQLRAALRSLRPRSLVAGALGVAAAVGLARFAGQSYPLRQWLIWDLLSIYGWQLLLVAGCLSFGHLVLAWLRQADWEPVALVTMSAAAGLMSFAMAMYLGGYLGLFHPVFAVVLPVAMLLAGARSAVVRLRALLPLPVAPSPGPWLWAGRVFGVLAIAILYLGSLSPEAVNYDAAWSHLVIAQDYAREGRIVPFLGDWNKNVPHLASLVNTWGFLVPGFREPTLRWMMALHTEFTLVLLTAVGVAAVARWLLEDLGVRGTWAVLFLFPGLYVYDSNLGGSSDHFLGFFAAPLFLAAVRVGRDFHPRAAAVLGALAAGALLTKLHAAYLLVPITLLLMARLALLGWRRRKATPDHPPARHLVLAPLVGLGCLVLFSLPHFGKNWLWHGNPFYPLMQAGFPGSYPTLPDAGYLVDHLFADWRWHPPGDLWTRVRETVTVVFTFAFRPHYSFVNNRPVFGFLFTLALLFLPLVPRARRLWVGAAVALGAVATWAATFLVDRNLQTFLPLLAGVTAALLVAAWRLGPAARAGVAALIAVQLLCGADLMVGSDRVAAGLALIRGGGEGHAVRRFDRYRKSYVDLGRALPRDARVLLHNAHGSLGIDRPVLLDWIGFQGLIDYRSFRSPRELHDRLAALGVTHLVAIPGWYPAASKQEEALFDAFVALHGRSAQRFGELMVWQMPSRPPPLEPAWQVVALGLHGYASGLYDVQALGTCEGLPPDRQRFPPPREPLSDSRPALSLFDRSQAVLIGAGVTLEAEAQAVLGRDFRKVASYPQLTVHARVPRQPPPPAADPTVAVLPAAPLDSAQPPRGRRRGALAAGRRAGNGLASGTDAR